MNSVFEVLGIVGIGLSVAATRRALTAPDPRLDTAGTTPRIDLAAAGRAVADLLTALGEDLDDDHLRDTPRRVAAAYAEMLTPRAFNPTSFRSSPSSDRRI